MSRTLEKRPESSVQWLTRPPTLKSNRYGLQHAPEPLVPLCPTLSIFFFFFFAKISTWPDYSLASLDNHALTYLLLIVNFTYTANFPPFIYALTARWGKRCSMWLMTKEISTWYWWMDCQLGLPAPMGYYMLELEYIHIQVAPWWDDRYFSSVLATDELDAGSTLKVQVKMVYDL